MTQEVNINDRTNGRWTKEEHQKFMLGLKLYGKNWKKIEELVVTRNGSQIRSHAQKYFMKINNKSSDSAQGNQNRDPESTNLNFKDKEITTKITNKKMERYPNIDSPFFWQQMQTFIYPSSEMYKSQSFCFWDLIELTVPQQTSLNTNQKSFVPYVLKTNQALKNSILKLNI